MANFNKVILAGRLTRDPQLSYLPSNTPVAEFGLAINRKWRSPEGESREDTCFVDCRCFGRQAETLNQYMRKGGSLLVEGHLRYETWETKEGLKRSRLSVVVDRFQFLGDRRDAERAGPPQAGRTEQYDRPAAATDYADAPGSAPAGRPEQYDRAPAAENVAPPGGSDIPF